MELLPAKRGPLNKKQQQSTKCKVQNSNKNIRILWTSGESKINHHKKNISPGHSTIILTSSQGKFKS